MATVTLLPVTAGTGLTAPWTTYSAQFTAVGDADKWVCLQTSGDSKYVSLSNPPTANGVIASMLNDTGALPVGAAISSVAVTMRHKTTAAAVYTAQVVVASTVTADFNYANFDESLGQTIKVPTSYATWSCTMTTNPVTGLSWARSDLFTNYQFGVNALGPAGYGDDYFADYFAVIVTYTTSAIVDQGWWLAVDNKFTSAASIVINSTPNNPRSFTEITAFASVAGSTWYLGGFPGPCGTWNNKLVYSPGGYTVGTTLPSIRLFDGTYDRKLVDIPRTSAGTVPKAVMTILVANGVVYLTTLDTGSSSADWVGRVFVLDVNTGVLTPLGDPITTGHVPYALAWHMGRLWVGTNRQDPTAAGKVLFYRPGIDTAWTLDATLSTGGVASMLSFQGLLYIGTTAPAATFAVVDVRSSLGAYTISDTGTGGTARANNGFLALAEFSGNMYASYFNKDTTNISYIRKFDGSSWTTSYTGAAGTLVPYLGFPIDQTTLLAIGGGLTYSAALVSTPDGTTWTDRTSNLPQNSPASSGLPAFGVIVK